MAEEQREESLEREVWMQDEHEGRGREGRHWKRAKAGEEEEKVVEEELEKRVRVEESERVERRELRFCSYGEFGEYLDWEQPA